MKFCPARRTLTIFTEPRLSGEDHGMKVLPIQPWGATPAPPVAPRKPPVSRKPEGPWPRARVTPMPPPPPYKGVVNQGYQANSPQFSPPPAEATAPVSVQNHINKRDPTRREPEETEEKRRRMEEAEEEKRKREEEDRKRRRVEDKEEEEREFGAEVIKAPGMGPPPCKCGKEAAEEEAKLLRLHNVRLRQVASALASKLRASEVALGASRADADARLAALVRALLAFEAGLRREQSRIKTTMDRLEALVRAQKAEIALLKAAGAAAGLGWEDPGATGRRQSLVEAEILGAPGSECTGSWSVRGIRPASILRDVLRSQLGAAWAKREEEEERKKKKASPGGRRIPGEGEEKGVEEKKMSGDPEVAESGVEGTSGSGGGGTSAADGGRGAAEGGGSKVVATERVKPPLPPRPRPRLTTASSEEGVTSCREEAKAPVSREFGAPPAGVAESRSFRGRWSPGVGDGRSGDVGGGEFGSSGDGGGAWGLNAHFEEFVLGEEPVSDMLPSAGRVGNNDEPPSTPPPPPPPSTPPPPATPPPSGTPPLTAAVPPLPTAKPRTALAKPPRKNPPPSKLQPMTAVFTPPVQFLLPDLLCPTPRGPEGIGEHERNGVETNGNAYLKENALNGDHHMATHRGVNGVSKGRPLAPSALQNAISPKGKHEAVLEAAKGHCSYERFLEMTGLSQKSILTFHRPIPPPPASTSRPLPPPPPKHRSVLKPRDVKMRSKAARTVGWEDGFVAGESMTGVVSTEAVVGPTKRYWSGPYL